MNKIRNGWTRITMKTKKSPSNHHQNWQNCPQCHNLLMVQSKHQTFQLLNQLMGQRQIHRTQTQAVTLIQHRLESSLVFNRTCSKCNGTKVYSYFQNDFNLIDWLHYFNCFLRSFYKALKKSYVDVFNPSGAVPKNDTPILAPMMPSTLPAQTNFFVPAAVPNNNQQNVCL